MCFYFSSLASAAVAQPTNEAHALFSLAAKGNMSQDRVSECHRAVTTYVVTLLILSAWYNLRS